MSVADEGQDKRARLANTWRSKTPKKMGHLPVIWNSKELQRVVVALLVFFLLTIPITYPNNVVWAPCGMVYETQANGVVLFAQLDRPIWSSMFLSFAHWSIITGHGAHQNAADRNTDMTGIGVSCARNSLPFLPIKLQTLETSYVF